MKSLYVTSVDQYSGKTALCLALGRIYQDKGLKVGYLKPFSLRPWRVGDKVADEDASFIIDSLGLNATPWELCPVVITPERLREYLSSTRKPNYLPEIKETVEFLQGRKDLILLEGGGSLREGYVVNLPTTEVAEALDSCVVVVVQFCEDACLLDDILAAKFRLKSALSGVVINRVPEKSKGFVNNLVVPYLENAGVPVLGVLPDSRELAALSVGEIIDVLEAEILTDYVDRNALVEALMVGAMTEDAALRRFRKQHNKAVITGGDRTDIQLAAMETSTTCLILTGNLHPSSLIIKQADAMQVPVLLVPGNTMETVETLDRIFGKTRLGQESKLDLFQKLVSQHVDLERLEKHLQDE
jgi:BioD-like phosphotransacetylase family protein